MALDRKPEPPRSVEEWRAVIRTTNLATGTVRAPRCDWDRVREDDPVSLAWTAPADHPYPGKAFCWRCVAEAQGLVHESAAHTSTAPLRETVVCWEAEGGEASEHPEPDTSQTRARGTVDRAPFADTGSFFYDPSYAFKEVEFDLSTEVGQQLAAIRGCSVEEPEPPTEPGRWESLALSPPVPGPVRAHPLPWHLEALREFKTIGQRIKEAFFPRPEPVPVHIHTRPEAVEWWGIPEETQPVSPDESERAPLPPEAPVPAHPSDDPDRRPGEDEAP